MIVSERLTEVCPVKGLEQKRASHILAASIP